MNSMGGYEPGAYDVQETARTTAFLSFMMRTHGRITAAYDGWWGHDTLPKLNYEDSPKLYEYIMKIAGKWVSAPYDADGWRLDVAADLGHSRGV